MTKKADKQELPSWLRVDREGLRIQVIFTGEEIDADGFMGEHALRTAFSDLLLAENQAFGKGARPWRQWEGCKSFAEILKRSIEKVKDQGILHVQQETRGGRVREIARPPAAGCIAKGCTFTTKALSGEQAVNALWSHLTTSSSNEADAYNLRNGPHYQDRSRLLHPTKQMMDQLNFWWNRDDELTQERNLASQGFPVAADRLKESRRIIGLPRTPTIEMHPSAKKTAGSGTGAAPPKKEEKPSTPRAWGAIDLDHYTSKRDASRKERAPGNAGTPRASSAGGRAPAVPARQLVISPRLHEPEEPPPARLKERAKLNPNPQAASKERARVLARSTPAARAAIRTKQASSGEQGSEDDPEDSQEDEREEEATGAQEGELEE